MADALQIHPDTDTDALLFIWFKCDQTSRCPLRKKKRWIEAGFSWEQIEKLVIDASRFYQLVVEKSDSPIFTVTGGLFNHLPRFISLKRGLSFPNFFYDLFSRLTYVRYSVLNMNMLTWIIYVVKKSQSCGGNIGVMVLWFSVLWSPTYRILCCQCLCAFLFALYRAMQFCSQVVLNNTNNAHSLV